MKTIIRITKDNYGESSYEMFKEDLYQLVNDINIFCEVKNDRMINIVEEVKKYESDKDDFKNTTIVEAKGYSQSDWQEYIIYHNLKENDKKLQYLVDELQKSFTHFNDYIVEKFEQTEIDGKKFNADPHDYTNFCIRYIEFPDKDDVLKEYLEQYGEDYDEVIIDIE